MTGAKKAPVVGALSNSAWARSPLRVTPRDAGPASRDRPATYSRILAEQPFTLRGVKPCTSRCASLNWPDALARVRSFWGKFLGQSVGALAALIDVGVLAVHSGADLRFLLRGTVLGDAGQRVTRV